VWEKLSSASEFTNEFKKFASGRIKAASRKFADELMTSLAGGRK